MFDEYLEPPRVERPVSPAQAVQAPVNSVGTSSSTTIDQDAPSLSISPSSSALQSQQGVTAEPTFMGNNLIAPVNNTPFINVFSPKPSSDASSSEDISSTESTYGKDNAIHQLKKQLSELQATCRDTECTVKVRTTNSQLTKVTNPVTNLQAQNDRFRAENDKVKQHYKQLKAKVQPSVLTRTKHAVDVELIVLRLRNNKDAHLDYLRHLKESVETIRDIVEEAKVVMPLDRSILSACRYTQHSQELLEYAIGTCPQGSQQ
nr:hypothetical protein [Tanacetum cinerariifolium]